MYWLLPMMLVVVVGLLIAGAHVFLMRWITRQSEPAPIGETETEERSDG